MAIKKTVIVDVKTKDAVKNVDNLTDSFIDLGDESQGAGEKGQEAVDGISEGSKTAEKNVGGLSKGFKTLGTAIKAAGIGLIIAAFVILKDVLTENQGVLDFFNIAFQTAKDVIRAVTGAISDAFTNAKELTGGFDALKSVIQGLITLALTPLRLNFLLIKLAVQAAQLVWEKSFFGKGRPERIDELQMALDETKDKIIEVGQEAATAGKNIVSNFKEAAGEISSLATSISTNISKISIAAITASAKTLIQFRNEAKIAIVELERLRLEGEKNAELQRQIRDDVSRSIKDRIEANLELNKILDEQITNQERQANILINLAEEELARANNIENQVALQEARNVLLAIEADIVGKRSEQLVNLVALTKELEDLETSRSKARIDSIVKILEFDAQIEKNEKDRLAKERSALNARLLLDKSRLNSLIESLELGTQARQDAQDELTQLTIDGNAELHLIELEEEELARENNLIRLESDMNNLQLSFEVRREAELEHRQLLLDDERLSLEERNALLADFAQKDIDTAEVVAQAKRDIRQAELDNLISAFSLIASLDEESKALQAIAIIGENAVGVAKQIINTQAANAAATLKYALLPGGEILAQREKLANNIALGLGIATSVSATAKALSALNQSGAPSGGGAASGGGTVGATGGGGISPQFNVIGASNINQLLDSIQGIADRPIRTFVTSQDIISQTQFDRQIELGASFGSSPD